MYLKLGQNSVVKAKSRSKGKPTNSGTDGRSCDAELSLNCYNNQLKVVHFPHLSLGSSRELKGKLSLQDNGAPGKSLSSDLESLFWLSRITQSANTWRLSSFELSFLSPSFLKHLFLSTTELFNQWEIYFRKSITEELLVVPLFSLESWSSTSWDTELLSVVELGALLFSLEVCPHCL